jgi:DNA-binding transcriptional LysR family regulator
VAVRGASAGTRDEPRTPRESAPTVEVDNGVVELRHLRYFVAVAEELNFSRAAERLFMAQPPLSQQIAKLEGEVGARLFNRTNRHVELTPAGEAFLLEARRALEAADHAVQRARNTAHGATGPLRLGFGVSVAFLCPPIVDAIAQEAPGVSLMVRQEDDGYAAGAARGGELDACIVVGAPSDHGLDGIVILRERWALEVSITSRYAGRSSVRLADVAGVRWMLGYGEGSQLFNRLVAAVIQACPEPSATVVANPRTQGPPSWAGDRDAAALVPSSQQVDGRLCKVAIEDAPSVEASLVWGRGGPITEVVADVVGRVAARRRWVRPAATSDGRRIVPASADGGGPRPALGELAHSA